MEENQKNIVFRTLRADEILCRVQSIKNGRLTLLLYKDARCDINILNETVGNLWWERDIPNKGECRVSLWNKEIHDWVGKTDVGTASQFEPEKGLASDAFKRANVNWTIGLELYSAPEIVLFAKKGDFKPCEGNPNATYDRFEVGSIEYNELRQITKLVILRVRRDESTDWKTKKQVVYSYGYEDEDTGKVDAQAIVESVKHAREMKQQVIDAIREES